MVYGSSVHYAAMQLKSFPCQTNEKGEDLINYITFASAWTLSQFFHCRYLPGVYGSSTNIYSSLKVSVQYLSAREKLYKIFSPFHLKSSWPIRKEHKLINVRGEKVEFVADFKNT